jgi:hypothetical protein
VIGDDSLPSPTPCGSADRGFYNDDFYTWSKLCMKTDMDFANAISLRRNPTILSGDAAGDSFVYA